MQGTSIVKLNIDSSSRKEKYSPADPDVTAALLHSGYTQCILPFWNPHVVTGIIGHPKSFLGPKPPFGPP